MNNDFQTLIIGAGPAGGMLALSLAIRGHKVALVEQSQFPRNKVCGCCLGPVGRNILKLYGIQPSGLPINTLKFSYKNKSINLSNFQSKVISRSVLDSEILNSAVAAGVKLYQPVTFDSYSRELDGQCKVNLHNGLQKISIQVKNLVLANGVRGGSMAGFNYISDKPPNNGFGFTAFAEAKTEEQCLDLYLIKNGYLGIAPLVGNKLVISGFLRRGNKQDAKTFIHETLVKNLGVENYDWQGGTGLLRSAPAVVAQQGAFLLGDAAGYLEPITGEGISWALEEALLLSQIITSNTINKEDAWVKTHAAFKKSRFRPCSFISRLARSPRLFMFLASLIDKYRPDLISGIHGSSTTKPLLIGSKNAG